MTTRMSRLTRPTPGLTTRGSRRVLLSTMSERLRSERGDVPGWVLVTLMTAMLVTVLLAVARTRLVELFNQAMDAVT